MGANPVDDTSYRMGYGQALADVRRTIEEAMYVIGDEIYDRRQFDARNEALRWVRAIVRAMRSPR